jgi:hypothetical protein
VTNTFGGNALRFVISQHKDLTTLCRALDPMITENVKRKVSVVGSNPKEIKKLFLEELHEEVGVCRLCTSGGQHRV